MLLAWLEEALSYLPSNPWIRGAVVLAVFIVLAKLTDWIGTAVIARWTRKSKTDLDDQLVEALHRPLFWSVILFGGWLTLDRFDLEPNVLTLVQRLLKTIAIVLWAAFAWRASRILLHGFGRLSQRKQAIQPKMVPLLDNTFKLLIFGGVVYFLFLTWGIDVAAWMAGAGIVGLALGLAAKDTLANIFSGIALIIDAPYEEGDFVVLGSGRRGMVTKIGLRSTRILTRDDIEITVPNSVISNEHVVNETRGPTIQERIRVDVGVAYGSDIDQVREVLIEIANGHAQVSPSPDPRVRFRAFGDSALNLQLLCWIDEPVLRGRVIDALLTEIYKRFQRDGIEIPYPQQDVYIRQMPDEDADSPQSSDR